MCITSFKVQMECFSMFWNKLHLQEVTADESDNQNLYEELYVHVSADTYEKVDAAVALIELLVTPVSVSSIFPVY